MQTSHNNNESAVADLLTDIAVSSDSRQQVINSPALSRLSSFKLLAMLHFEQEVGGQMNNDYIAQIKAELDLRGDKPYYRAPH